MKPRFNWASPGSSIVLPASPWYAILAIWFGAVALSWAFAQQNSRLVAEIKASERSATISKLSVELPGFTERTNFVAALSVSVERGEAFRFASRLAQDQNVRMIQMQSEAIHTETNKLGQAKFTLQLAGDYANIKSVLIGLLAKFPGLTLQHMTIRHRDASSGNAADKGSDEATLELIQYVRPATMS